MESRSKSSDLHEASFSSYLTQEENFVPKLTAAQSGQVTPAFTSTQERNDKAVEGEIRVFDAEKYFKMNLEEDGPRIIDTLNLGKHVHETEHRADLQRLKPKSRIGTPSVSSEASWNSQTALLPRNSPQVKHHKGNERWFFSGFACSGSCTAKKSVFVDTNVVHRALPGKESRKESVLVSRSPISLEGRKFQAQSRIQGKEDFLHSPSFERISNIGSKREGYLVLPTVNSRVQGMKIHREDHKILDEDPRTSLEVFGSHLIKKEDIAQNLERKLSVLTWDAILKTPKIPTNSATSQVLEELDAASEASSDLFEIENISANTLPRFSKQVSDAIPGCMSPTSRYEPSESSIEWSVVTASAADFSAASDYDEKMLAENIAHPGFASSTTPTRKSRPNSLLGCKSLQAVDVAETTYKINDKAKSHLQQHRIRPDVPRPVRKLQAEIKVKDLDFLSF